LLRLSSGYRKVSAILISLVRASGYDRPATRDYSPEAVVFHLEEPIAVIKRLRALVHIDSHHCELRSATATPSNALAAV
jgi:hypothetical protein